MSSGVLGPNCLRTFGSRKHKKQDEHEQKYGQNDGKNNEKSYSDVGDCFLYSKVIHTNNTLILLGSSTNMK